MNITFRSSALSLVIERPQEFLHPSGATTTITSVGAFLPLSVIRELVNAPVEQRTEFLNTLVVNVTKSEDDLHTRATTALNSVAVDFADTLADLAK